MTPRRYANWAQLEFGKALDHDSEGLIEDLQCVTMVLVGMVLALAPPDQPKQDEEAGR